MVHWPGCPAGENAGPCECVALEERAVERASRPSPAELIRRAQQRGWVKEEYSYAQSA